MSIEAGRSDQTLTVRVYAPRSPDPKEFSWAKTTKVSDAAREAADAFGYEPGGTPTLKPVNGGVLDRNKPLVAEGIQDGDELELVDIGGGV